MADEKIVKIVAQVEGNSGASPEQTEKARIEAAHRARVAQEQADEARRRSLLGSFSVDTEGGQGPLEAGRSGRRGRPRKAPWDPNGMVPPPPPKGRAGAPPLPEDDDPTSPAGQSKLAKAWKIFQKGITAVNGANGHLTKSVAFATRTFEFAKDGLDDLKNAGITASGAMNAVKGSASAAAGRFGVSAAMAGKLATAAGAASVGLGAAGLAAAGFTVQLGITVGALKILTHVTENMQEVVGNFSAALQAARANTKIAEIQTRLRSAQQVGGELASLESSKGRAERAIIETKTELVDLFSPVIKASLAFFTQCLEQLKLTLQILNFISNIVEKSFEAVLNALTYIPGISWVAKKALAIMEQDKINDQTATTLHRNVQDLFDQDNFQNKPSKAIASKFLP